MSPITAKKLSFQIVTVLTGLVLALLAGEIFVRVVDPQPYMYPRFKFSSHYGHLLFPNERIVDALPGKFEFHYSTNSLGLRGPVVPTADTSGLARLVVIGDSYAFGKGVNDGEEFPAIMRSMLAREFDVVNLSVIGFGLTQEIRIFHDLGIKYSPRIVLLQFCKNDPGDNLLNPVTQVHNERFVFTDTPNSTSLRIQTLVSRSQIQLSQLYNFVRLKILVPLQAALQPGRPASEEQDTRAPRRETGGSAQTGYQGTAPEGIQQTYVLLLRAFAQELTRMRIRFVMVSVNGELESFPYIEAAVLDLDRTGLLEYHDVRPWFDGVTGYESPEGHVWGAKGHRIVAENLVRVLRHRQGSQ